MVSHNVISHFNSFKKKIQYFVDYRFLKTDKHCTCVYLHTFVLNQLQSRTYFVCVFQNLTETKIKTHEQRCHERRVTE